MPSLYLSIQAKEESVDQLVYLESEALRVHRDQQDHRVFLENGEVMVPLVSRERQDR